MTIEFKKTCNNTVAIFVLLCNALVEEVNDAICINAYNAENNEAFEYSIYRKDLEEEVHTEEKDVYLCHDRSKIEITYI